MIQIQAKIVVVLTERTRASFANRYVVTPKTVVREFQLEVVTTYAGFYNRNT